MRQVEIELDGVVVRASLDDERAPVTVGKLWECLPFEDRVTHAKWSGHMFHTNTELPVDLGEHQWPLGVENPVGFQAPGDFVFLPAGKELALAYGDAQFSWMLGPMLVTAVGRIVDDLAEFAAKAERLQWEGAKRLVIRRAEPQRKGTRA